MWNSSWASDLNNNSRSTFAPSCVHRPGTQSCFSLENRNAEMQRGPMILDEKLNSFIKLNAFFHAVLSQQSNQGDTNMRSILAEIGITTFQDHQKQSPRTKFQYTKEQLYALADTPFARKRPPYLDSAHFNDSGAWDPERWAMCMQEKSSQPQEESRNKRERPSDLEREVSGKRRPTGIPIDPKERIREEQDGIILSPQRRSFGTGCHVTQQPVVNRRPESPSEGRGGDRDNHRDTSRRIGSGRILSRDRDRDREREFGYRSANDRRDRDRYERDDGRDGRFGRTNKEREIDRRGGRDKGCHRRINEEREPEWFSGGPTSQSETIELRGFDDVHEPVFNGSKEKQEKDSSRRDKKKNWRRQKTPSLEDIAQKEENVDKSESLSKNRQSVTSSVEVGDTLADGKVSDGGNKEDESIGGKSEFDFNDLFDMDAIPGIFARNNASPANCHAGLMGSRFGQFFQNQELASMQNHNSGGMGRMASYQDELIGPVMNSATEPTISIPSPTSGSDIYFTPISPAQPTVSADTAGKSLMELLQPHKTSKVDEQYAKNSKNTELRRLDQATSVQELEAGLKNLLLVNQGSTRQSSPGSPLVQQQSIGNESNAFSKLLSQISDGKITAASSQSLSLGPIDSSQVLQEQDILKGNTFTSEGPSNNAHLMSILKNAPTEQDILAALGHRSSQSQHPSGSQGGISINSNLQNNPLAKIVINQGSSVQTPDNLYNFAPTHLGQTQQPSGRMNENIAMQLGVRGGQIGRQPMMQPQQPSANSIQQQQREILAAILKQQQQAAQPLQQGSIQPPIIQRPPSPPSRLPQAHLIRDCISPNSHSPHNCDNIQQAMLQQQQQQQQQRPRIPSPLIFGQTPPVISHAPSPIHPSQMSQSIAPTGNSLNPNTLHVHTPHVITRVPSPQELRAHTQQIMQNALIKKKLEEQKENYRKRQELHGSRSPNPSKMDSMTVMPSTGNASGKSPVVLAQSFTPTAVMRKMQAGKEKEASKTNTLLQQPAQMVIRSHGNVDMVPIVPTTGCGHTDGDMLQAPPSLQIPVHRLGFVNGQVSSHCGSTVPLSPNLSNQLPLQGRRIVKSNQSLSNQVQRGVNSQAHFMGARNKPFLSNSGNYDVMKQLRIQQQAAQCQPMTTSTLAHGNMAMSGSTSINPSMCTPGAMGPVRPIQGTGNIHLRGMIPATANPLSQLNPLAALQQRVVDPRQLPPASNQLMQAHNLHPLAVQQLFMGVGAAGRQSLPLSSVGGHQSGITMDQSFHSTMNPNVSDLLKSASGLQGSGASGGRHSPVNNLAKWFGSDVLTQKMTDLPPVPMQKAQYVEEVEQRQQQASVQN